MGFTERRHFLVLDKAVCSHVPSLIKHGEEGSDRHVIRYSVCLVQNFVK